MSNFAFLPCQSLNWNWFFRSHLKFYSRSFVDDLLNESVKKILRFLTEHVRIGGPWFCCFSKLHSRILTINFQTVFAVLNQDLTIKTSRPSIRRIKNRSITDSVLGICFSFLWPFLSRRHSFRSGLSAAWTFQAAFSQWGPVLCDMGRKLSS